MNNFDKILTNIQKELHELQKINRSLLKENAYLREQLTISASNNNDDLSLEDAFKQFSLRDDTRGKKISAFNCLKRAGYKNIGDLKNKSIYDLIKTRHAGASTCAIWIILLEHCDIHVELPDMDSITSSREYKTIKKIYEELPKFRERIVFQK
jgi:DNA-directed RNA polymerase alpha subunit